MKAIAVAMLLVFMQFHTLRIDAQRAPSPSETGAITGLVTRTGTKEPISNVAIVLIGTTGLPFTAMTDAGGRFTLENVAAGSYLIRASREGYVAAMTNNVSNEVTTSVRVVPRERVEATGLNLSPGLVVTGRVLDPSEKPVPGLVVEAVRTITNNSGLLQIEPIGGISEGRTNDLGEYRMYWLTPGTYYVRVRSEAGSFPFETTYFPATSIFQNSIPVTLSEGIENRVDFKLPTFSGQMISGKVMNQIPGLASLPDLSLFLISRDSREPVESRQNSGLKVSSGRGGQFELKNVRPGSYDIYVQASVSGSVYIGKAAVAVVDRDIDGLLIPLRPGFDVTGRVTVNGVPAKMLDVLSDSPNGALGGGGGPIPLGDALFRPSLSRKDGFKGTDASYLFPGTGLEPGSFRLLNVPPGLYNVSAGAARFRDSFVVDILQGGRSILNDGLMIGDEAPSPIEIQLSTHVSTITVNITNAEAKDVPILLIRVPETYRDDARLFEAGSVVELTGSIRLTSVPPGKYKLFAWQGELGDPGMPPFRSPDFLSQFGARGISVEVKEGMNLAGITVPLIRNSR